MRELRVEDALLYLDQVKVEFGDRPHIYNEFLDIMKTFKTQQIDTPGVIRRVSNLFQGNKKLVLGFNTFLPEGYKIELPIDGDGPPVAVFRAPGETSVTHILTGPGAPFVASPAPAAVAGAADAAAAAARMAAPTQGRARPGPHGPAGLHEAAMRGGPPGLGQQRGPLGQQQPGGGLMGQSSVAGVASYPPGPAAHMQQQGQRPGQPGPSQQQMMSVADAATRARLEQQARGPPGQQIPGRGPHAPGAGRPGMPGQQQQVMAGESQARAGMPGAPAAVHHAAAMQQNSHPIGMHAPAPPQPAAAAAPQPPLEFDHAINYVTTIKKRFSSEPETYKKFLEILHTYQKEQRGIKEVLDEVSVLFADHPDLLKEFTYFLPDAVQAQAKAQLDQVAKESEARQRAASSKQAIMQQAKGMQNRAMSLKGDRSPPQAPSVPPPVQRETTPPLQHSPPPPPPPPQPVQTVMPIPFGATQGRTVEREREIYRTVVYGTVSFAPMRPPRKNSLTVKQAAAKNGRPVMLPTLPRQPTTAETAFFERAKRHLNRKELAPDKPSGSRRHTPYTEFLKCLHLFGAGVLNKDELVLLLRGLFVQGHAPKSGVNAGGGASNPTIANDAHDLLRDFEEILVGRGQYADQETSFKDKSKYGSTRSRDFDFRDCDRPTPSYVTHPVDYPTSLFVSNSGQNEGDAKVLNNKLICVGAEKMRLSGSPEDYEAVRIRRNAYEEAMFRIEDERFEVDMAIERNAHAMRQVEPIAEEVSALRENEEKDGQPIGRCQYQLKSRTLNSIQINAIGRIYGDSGDEVIEHLSRNPLSVVPIVYQRLRQKDAEWRKQKNELMEKWRLSSEENYEGNMDYLCYFSRRELERSFGSEQLRDECRRAKNYYTNPERKANSPVDFGMSNFDRSALMYQPYCVVDMKPSSLVHHHAVRLLSQQVAIKAAKTPADREKIGRIWTEFVVPFFDYPAHWLLNEARESFQGRLNNYVVKYANGQRVRTAFGDGTILSYMEGNEAAGGRYRIKFPFGIGFVRPSAIVHGLRHPDGAKYVRRAGQMEKEDDMMTERGALSSAKLDGKFKQLFGSDHVYLFLRLFSFLIALLDEIESFVRKNPTRGNPTASYYNPMKSESEKEKSSAKLDFQAVMVNLEKVISKKMSAKEFESFCRQVSTARVHKMAALPKLLEKCADTLAKVAEEDLILRLYDYCQYRGMDPVHLRSQCLTTSPDASYRIQYNTMNGRLYFSYLPEGEELLTVPVEEPDDEVGEGMEDGEAEYDDDDDDDDEEHMDIDDEDEEIRVVKRPKVN